MMTVKTVQAGPIELGYVTNLKIRMMRTSHVYFAINPILYEPHGHNKVDNLTENAF